MSNNHWYEEEKKRAVVCVKLKEECVYYLNTDCYIYSKNVYWLVRFVFLSSIVRSETFLELKLYADTLLRCTLFRVNFCLVQKNYLPVLLSYIFVVCTNFIGQSKRSFFFSSYFHIFSDRFWKYREFIHRHSLWCVVRCIINISLTTQTWMGIKFFVMH